MGFSLSTAACVGDDQLDLGEAHVALVDDSPELLAAKLLETETITFVDTGDDEASARQNIVDTAQGRSARSRYGSAPGGSVYLDVRMLQGMLALSETHTFRVTEIAGGSHSRGSRHYDGMAFDAEAVQVIAGTVGIGLSGGIPNIAETQGVSEPEEQASFRAFMARARALGATEVLGPGSAGHSTHVHTFWPR